MRSGNKRETIDLVIKVKQITDNLVFNVTYNMCTQLFYQRLHQHPRIFLYYLLWMLYNVLLYCIVRFNHNYGCNHCLTAVVYQLRF